MSGLDKYMNRMVALCILVLVGLFGCVPATPSPLDTEGVERVTPRGKEWEHVSGIAWSPDGTQLALTWSTGLIQHEPVGYLYVLDLETHEPRKLVHTEGKGEFANPSWSPTTDQVAFYTNGWSPAGIWLADLGDQNAPTFLGEGTECTWSPDGQRIAIGDIVPTGYVIYVLNVRTGKRQEVVHLPNEGQYMNVWGLTWSPTGDRLAFSFGLYDQDKSTREPVDIYELDITTGEYDLLTQGGENVYPSWSPDSRLLAFVGGMPGEQVLVIMDLEGGSTIRSLDGFWLGPVAWSPDGDKIAFVWSSSVYTLDTQDMFKE